MKRTIEVSIESTGVDTEYRWSKEFVVDFGSVIYLPVQDVTVGGVSVVSGGVAAIPAIPTVPTISTSVTDDASSDTKTSSPKSVKTYVDNICGNVLTILESI